MLDYQSLPERLALPSRAEESVLDQRYPVPNASVIADLYREESRFAGKRDLFHPS